MTPILAIASALGGMLLIVQMMLRNTGTRDITLRSIRFTAMLTIGLGVAALVLEMSS